MSESDTTQDDAEVYEDDAVQCMSCLNWMAPFNPLADDHLCRTCLEDIQVGDRRESDAE